MIPKYYSARSYAKKCGLGEAEVKKMISKGFIKAWKTEGGQYKIPDIDNSVPIELYEKLLKENEKLKTIIRNIYNISKEVNNG